MNSWFVSGHPGAIAWMRRQHIPIDHWVAHLKPEEVQVGDQVYGTLPIHLAARVCQRGARYFHLQLDLLEDPRGQELAASALEEAQASFSEYLVVRPGVWELLSNE